MTPDLQMVMNAKNNNQGMMGLMNQASVEPKKGIEFLMTRKFDI